MLIHPGFDPIALQIGPVAVRWYGIMYLLGFAAGWWLGQLRASRPSSPWSREQVSDLVFYIALGVVLGGRVGYVLFYGLEGLLADPLRLIRIWEGDMSFHGGFLGVLVAMLLFGRRYGYRFLEVTDFIAPLIPPGLFFGRIGNFINGELWGRTTDVPWAMLFPGAGSEPRHPSQLYEAGLEGVAMFVILWIYSGSPRAAGAVSGLFLILYGTFRSVVELVREPDAHIGFVGFEWLTMGQLLSLPMIVAGAWLFLRAQRVKVT